MSARRGGAGGARAIGLSWGSVPDEAARSEGVTARGETLAGQAPLTMRTIKEALRRLRVDGPAAHDEDLVVEAYMSEDFKEGMEAFLAKRKPNWKGR